MSGKRKTNDCWDPKTVTKKVKATKDSDLDEFLVIGIDFGTTYSGVAWATAADFANDHINLITTWPGARLEEAKVPTTLSYKPGLFGGHTVDSWGYEVPHDEPPVSWFKLLLLHDEDIPDKIRSSIPLERARAMLENLKVTAVGVISDYLKKLWEHALKVITKARSAAVLDALRLHVVLTVPASWKDYTRLAMKTAADRAGITSTRPAGDTALSFAIEPEAAAFATIWEKERSLKTGEVYMVCDAGGGTVDIITYKVGSLNPLELHEAVGGEAGIYGGIFIDDKFRRICQDRLGGRWHNLSLKGVNEIMQTEWEHAVKTTFSLENKNKKYIISIPAEAFEKKADMNDTSREPHIRDGRIYFSSSDIQMAFDDSFAKIGDLVARQIARVTPSPVTAIILVGGLGSSPYLHDYLSKKYQGKTEVLQAGGMKPRSAICRGAVYKGFLDRINDNSCGLIGQAPMSVASTIARLSLGVEVSLSFIPGYHPEEDKYWNPFEGKWLARKRMQWYLKKGDVIATAKPIKHSFYQVSLGDKFKKGFTTDILQCERDCPPDRRDESVTQLGKIDLRTKDLAFADVETFPSAEDGRKCKKMSYELEMVPSGASTLVAAYCHGKKLGTRECQLNLT